MPCHADHIDRWIDVALGRTSASLFSRSRTNVFAIGDELYSYGTHFELARLIRDKKGKPSHFLLNGDTYSVTTSRHQRLTRDAIARSGLPSAIVPHSALAAAGVRDLNTVTLLDVTADTFRRDHHRSTERPEGSVWKREPVHGSLPRPDDEVAAIIEQRTRSEELRHHYHVVSVLWPEAWHGDTVRAMQDRPKPITRDDLNPWELVDSHAVIGHKNVLYRSARHSWRGIIDVDRDENNAIVGYRWETTHHQLGESLIKARVESSRFVECDHGLTSEGECSDGKCWSRWATRSGRTVGRTVVTSRPVTLLSGFDMHESRPLYFLCELPRGAKPTTVAEAYEDLKPETVKLAEAAGLDVLRQGDIFAVPTGLTLREIRRLPGTSATVVKAGRLLGTNHYATDVAYLSNGVTLMRGTMTHRPAGRRPDHGRVTMPKGVWHIAIKNTVPVSR